MFKRKRPKTHETISARHGELHADVEALCDRLCVAFDPGRHATREIASSAPSSDRLIRTLRTLLRVSRHRRQKIEQSVQQELSSAASLRDTITELSDQTVALERRLAACETRLTSCEATRPDHDIKSDEPDVRQHENSNPQDAVETQGEFECAHPIAHAESESPATSFTNIPCHDEKESAGRQSNAEQVSDSGPSFDEPPTDEAEAYIDFNAMLANAINTADRHLSDDSATESLGGLDAFESTLSQVESGIEAAESRQDAPVESASSDLQTAERVDAACSRARTAESDLTVLIDTTVARYRDLQALNEKLENQLSRRENLLARVDHELRERQILLVTDIMRAEAEHLSLTEALEAIADSVRTMTGDIAGIGINPTSNTVPSPKLQSAISLTEEKPDPNAD